MCPGTCQEGRIRQTEPETKLEIEAEIITQQPLKRTNPYTMNHIQVQRVMCDKVGPEIIPETTR